MMPLPRARRRIFAAQILATSTKECMREDLAHFELRASQATSAWIERMSRVVLLKTGGRKLEPHRLDNRKIMLSKVRRGGFEPQEGWADQWCGVPTKCAPPNRSNDGVGVL